MKSVLLALLMTAGVFAAQAQVTGNLGLTTDYRYRGISQTQNAPAIQGGVDYSHSSGFYAGNWNSSVSSSVYTNGAGVESDLYAGYKREVLKGLTLDVGSMNYFYPRATNGTSDNFDTKEIYAGLSYGIASAKYSRSISNYFGTANSKGSEYIQADVAYPVKGTKFTAVAHAGHTNVANSNKLDYTDYNVGASYDLGQGWATSAKYHNNTGLTGTAKTANTVNGQQLYKNAVVLGVTRSF
jgi:uncharacterized protein (TIGR02001 family)